MSLWLVFIFWCFATPGDTETVRRHVETRRDVVEIRRFSLQSAKLLEPPLRQSGSYRPYQAKEPVPSCLSASSERYFRILSAHSKGELSYVEASDAVDRWRLTDESCARCLSDFKMHCSTSKSSSGCAMKLGKVVACKDINHCEGERCMLRACAKENENYLSCVDAFRSCHPQLRKNAARRACDISENQHAR